MIPTKYLDYAKCRSKEVNPDWWVETDDPTVRPETYWILKAEEHQSAVRAKLYCYQCPIVDICREEAWDEPAGVWAGLDGGDRFTARQDGEVKLGSQDRARGKSTRPKVASMFLSGLGVAEIAATMNYDVKYVWYQISATLAEVRAQEEPLLCEITPPPPLSPGRQSRTGFRFGQATSSEPEATEQMPESA